MVMQLKERWQAPVGSRSYKEVGVWLKPFLPCILIYIGLYISHAVKVKTDAADRFLLGQDRPEESAGRRIPKS